MGSVWKELEKKADKLPRNFSGIDNKPGTQWTEVVERGNSFSGEDVLSGLFHRGKDPSDPKSSI